MIPLLFALRLNAETLHLSLTGSGTRDGSTWANAYGPESVEKVVNEVMKPGDTLLVGPGVYENMTLKILRGGGEGQPKTIIGIDNGFGLPVWGGTWAEERPDKGSTIIEFAPGASHVVLERLRIKGAVTGVSAPAVKGAPPRSNLVFRDVDVSLCRHGYYLADCDDLLLASCDVKRYTKHGFRLDQGCDRVLFQHCHADCSEGEDLWETKTELLPFGFFVNDAGQPSTAVQFVDCLARNNMMPHQKNSYKNGDGFVVEENAVNVTFSRCRALRNQDGGFDLKAKNVRLIDCIGIGNSRTFRVWNGGRLSNCFAGWAQVGLWSNGGSVNAERCTFHELTETAVLADDKASGPVTLSDCLISATKIPHRSTSQGTIVMEGTLTSENPDYMRPSSAWEGMGDAMNSRAHPGKGFHSEFTLPGVGSR